MSGKIKRVKIRGRGPGGLAGTLGAAVAFLLFLGAALAVLSGEITVRAEAFSISTYPLKKAK